MISPTELPAAMKDQMNTQLPKGKTIVDVFADFMRYLFDSTKELFKASEPSGELRWDTVSDTIELVLTHPNEWGGPQQTQLRTAAVRAGIVPDTPAGRSRVHFVTEGEASFNFCATNTEAGEGLKVCSPTLFQSSLFDTSQPGEQVLIIDAGGGTIDISTYTVLNTGPLQVEELYQSECESDGLHSQMFSLKNFHFRFAPRWRVRHCESKSHGPRCVLIFLSQTGCSSTSRKIGAVEIQHARGPCLICPKVRRRGEEGFFKRPGTSICQIWLPERQ